MSYLEMSFYAVVFFSLIYLTVVLVKTVISNIRHNDFIAAELKVRSKNNRNPEFSKNPGH